MEIINFIYAFFYGIVEGITEWLPISSTGHLIILERYLKFTDVSDAFFEMFLVVIQLGAIIAVIVTFFNQLNPFRKEDSIKKDVFYKWKLIFIGCLPAAICGFFLNDFLDQYLYNDIVVSICLIVYGVIFIVVEHLIKKKKFKYQEVTSFSLKTALIIGIGQVLSLIPGTSRSGITILSALLIGCNRESSLEYSFYLSIPIMIGASGLKIVKYFIEGNIFTLNEFMIILTGMISAFAISLLVVKYLMNFIKKHSFLSFGYYRIVLGIIVLLISFVL